MKQAYEVKFNDFGVVYVVAENYSQAETAALKMLSELPKGTNQSENIITGIIKPNQTKEALTPLTDDK